MLKCKRQCHCAEIETCIINDVGIQAVHKKHGKQTLYTRVLKVNISLQRKKNPFKKCPSSMTLYLPYKTGCFLKEVQFIYNFLSQDKEKVTF
jgi:hypothetical protein